MNQAEDRKAKDAETPAKGGLQLEVFDVLPEIVLPDEESQLARLVVEMAGKKLVVFFLADPRTSAASALLREFAQLYDALSPYCRIYGITATPPEVNRCALEETLPFSLLSDVKGQVFRGLDIDPGARAALTVLIADEDCRILRIDRNADAADYAAGVLRFFQNLPKPEPRQLGHFAPVLYIPKVFEPGFCEALIAFYEREGGAPSPSYVEEAGEPRFLYGDSKVRHDCQISDAEMIAAITRRISRRVLPGILKAFTRRVTGIEKFKIGCYEASEGGRFAAHRDNISTATAHRRFAMSVNLNTGHYEGGFLQFPEFGPDLYRPDTGDAVVYSSALLHEVTPITSGRRFTLLAHMYDEESRQLNPKYRDSD